MGGIMVKLSRRELEKSSRSGKKREYRNFFEKTFKKVLTNRSGSDILIKSPAREKKIKKVFENLLTSTNKCGTIMKPHESESLNDGKAVLEN